MQIFLKYRKTIRPLWGEYVYGSKLMLDILYTSIF